VDVLEYPFFRWIAGRVEPRACYHVQRDADGDLVAGQAIDDPRIDLVEIGLQEVARGCEPSRSIVEYPALERDDTVDVLGAELQRLAAMPDETGLDGAIWMPSRSHS